MFEFSLYIDADRPGGMECLLDGKSSSFAQAEPQLAQGDELLLKLFFRRRGAAGAASTAVQLATGANIVLAAKEEDGLAEATLLFSAAAFVETGTGDDLHYESALNLNTDELDAAITGGDPLPVRVDVEVQNGGNTYRLTYQFDMAISPQVYDGEADPTPGTPAYPHPDLIVTKIRGTVAIPSGASSVAVSGLALGAVPAQILPKVRKPTAGAPRIDGDVLDDSVTADGFTFELGAAAPASGYKLDYLLIM